MMISDKEVVPLQMTLSNIQGCQSVNWFIDGAQI